MKRMNPQKGDLVMRFWNPVPHVSCKGSGRIDKGMYLTIFTVYEMYISALGSSISQDRANDRLLRFGSLSTNHCVGLVCLLVRVLFTLFKH